MYHCSVSYTQRVVFASHLANTAPSYNKQRETYVQRQKKKKETEERKELRYREELHYKQK